MRGVVRGAIGMGVWAVLLLPSQAGAGTLGISGPNSDFPDAHVVMPFSAVGDRTTFFAMHNLLEGAIAATWTFFDERGVLLAVVDRDILDFGGTDIVDVTNVRNRFLQEDGTFVEGPAQSLAGSQGFVIVTGDGEPRLVGNFTIANIATSSAFGASAAGFGSIGALVQDTLLLGTSFSPRTLDDNLLIVLALNDPVLTSLTDGEQPPAGSSLVDITVSLHGNEGDGRIAETTVAVSGSALFSSLESLFPGTTLDTSATIAISATEGEGFSGSGFDNDDDSSVSVIGYYGQALGPFGGGQNLRTAFFE